MVEGVRRPGYARSVDVSRSITRIEAYQRRELSSAVMADEHPREDDREDVLPESPAPDPEEKDPRRPDEDPPG
jgi:hypothetical protein